VGEERKGGSIYDYRKTKKLLQIITGEGVSVKGFSETFGELSEEKKKIRVGKKNKGWDTP